MQLCFTESQKLVDKKKLKAHCDKHDISYHGALSFLRGHRKRKNHGLAVKFLKSLGYNLELEKIITYNYYFTGDDHERVSKIMDVK